MFLEFNLLKKITPVARAELQQRKTCIHSDPPLLSSFCAVSGSATYEKLKVNEIAFNESHVLSPWEEDTMFLSKNDLKICKDESHG